MSPVDGPGRSNPNLPVDPAVREGRVPARAEEQIPELHEVDCPPELAERIETLMGRYPDRRSASIPALWAVQERYGWCTPEGIRQAAAVMRVTPGYLESVASFYDLGACDIAPLASFDQRYYGPLEAAEAGVAIEQLRAGDEVLPGKALARRGLAGDA